MLQVASCRSVPEQTFRRCLRIEQTIRVGACEFHACSRLMFRDFLEARSATSWEFVGDACQRSKKKQTTGRLLNMFCGSLAKKFQSKSLIMAQIERWRQALYMQVER